MLESTRPFGAPVRPYLSPQVTFGPAAEAWQVSGYWALRHEIFCGETQLFGSEREERDEHDALAVPIVALAHSAGTPEAVVGIVRIYAADGGRWFGGRLGVASGYRPRMSVGPGLIRCAVQSAIVRGCRRFQATVLAENAQYFTRQHFRPLHGIERCGRAHVLMEADLRAFIGSRASALRGRAA